MSPETRDEPRDQPDDLSLALSEDMLAAEYVLGTLDAEERKGAKDRIASDPAFAALVARWERRLGELHVLTADMEPPPAVWDAIKEKLAETAPSETVRLPDPTPPPTPSPPPSASPPNIRVSAGAGGAVAHACRLHGIARGRAARLHPAAEMGAAAALALPKASRAGGEIRRARVAIRAVALRRGAGARCRAAGLRACPRCRALTA